MRKPALSPKIKKQIKLEYGLGAGVNELGRKYKRGKSIISRLCKDVTRGDEDLAIDLAGVTHKIGLKGTREQTAILKRSQEIEVILDRVNEGTDYITKRTLSKLKLTTNDDLPFKDLLTAQEVMNKAHNIAVPKIDTQVNVQNNITGIKLIPISK